MVLEERAVFPPPQSSQFHKHRVLHASQLREFSYRELTHLPTYIYIRTIPRDHTAHVLSFAWVLVRRDGTGRCGRGGQRANQAGEARFSLRGWGFGLGSPAASPLPQYSPASPIAIAWLLLLLLPSPIRGVVVEYGVRDSRGSILQRVEGVHERPWHAHTPRQAGVDLRTRTPYANLFPLCQRLCWYSSSYTIL